MAASNLRDEAWARRTLVDFGAIKIGHTWLPEGWSGWHLTAKLDPADLKAVTVSAKASAGPHRGFTFTPVYRDDIQDIQALIDEFFRDLRQITDLSDNLADLAAQPSPTIPEWVVEALKRDLANPATVTFNEARAVLHNSRRSSHSETACP